MEKLSWIEPGVGLVLSGGGAKGAYQVGVVRALQDLGVTVDAVAGASIGALNGAVFVAAADQGQALERLLNIWTQLADESPLRPAWARVPAYLTALAGFGLTLTPLFGGGAQLVQRLVAGAVMHSKASEVFRRNLRCLLPALQERDSEGLLCDVPLKTLIDQYVPAGGLPQRVPLFVSVYPAQQALYDVLRAIGAMLSIVDTKSSEYLKVQDQAVENQKKLLMASAALPLLFGAQQVDGTRYSDGGQGEWFQQDGNTPIRPLLDAGYRRIIVTHLSDGVPWDRHRFPNAAIMEIRPRRRRIERNGALADVIGFDNARIKDWIDQGHEDTMACIGEIKEVLNAELRLTASERDMEHMLQDTGQAAMRAALRKL